MANHHPTDILDRLRVSHFDDITQDDLRAAVAEIERLRGEVDRLQAETRQAVADAYERGWTEAGGVQ